MQVQSNIIKHNGNKTITEKQKGIQVYTHTSRYFGPPYINTY